MNMGEGRPYSLKTKVVPQSTISKFTLERIIEQISHSKCAKDRIDLDAPWKGSLTKRDKLY